MKMERKKKKTNNVSQSMDAKLMCMKTDFKFLNFQMFEEISIKYINYIFLVSFLR